MHKPTMRGKLFAGMMTLALTIATFAGPGDGDLPVDAVKILDNGPDTDRFVLVLLAEGYTAGQLDQFATDAQQFVDTLVSTPPFDLYCQAFNVYRVDVASDESGADDPAGDCDGTGAIRATYFDATYCGDGAVRRLLVVNNVTATGVMNFFVPEWDQGLVLVNSTIWGGAGGTPGTTSLSSGWEGIAIHEIGHSVFGLADEYEYWEGCSSGETDRDNHPGPEPTQPNVTVQSDPDLVKWNALFFSDPPPGTVNADCTICDPQPNPFPGEMRVGLYEGAHYYHCDAFRPTFNCMMRNFDDFCPVCVQRITQQLDPYLPANAAPVCDAGGPYVAECQGGGLTSVQLDGTGSTDDGCVPLTYTWTGGFVGGVAAGVSPTVQFAGLGDFAVQLEVSDGQLSSVCNAMVTVQDTTPPSITAPADQLVECTGAEGTPVDLGTPLVDDTCDDAPTVENDAPALFPLGDTVVTWTATDASGNANWDTQTVTVEDTTPPTLIVTVSPSSLWAPNHKWATITADIIVEDICDDLPVVRLVSIASNEPVNTTGDGNTEPDIQGAAFGTDDREFEVRVERRGNGTGRSYTITYEAEDSSGNVTITQAWVTVSHDRRKP